MTLIDNFACCTVAIELQDAGHEVGIADAVGGRSEGMHIDSRSRREIHARWVGHDHLAVGIDLTINLRGRVAQNTVQQHAAARRLRDVDFGLRTHIEALPVNDRSLAALGDGHQGFTLGNFGSTRRDLATRWQLRGRYILRKGCTPAQAGGSKSRQ